MEDPVSVRAMVHGRVQGVFFRTFVEEHAQRLGLVGYVRNLPSGAVEVMAEGERERVNKLLERLKMGPSTSMVDGVDISWFEFTGDHSEFRVRY
jgi:acylphosphatase